MENILIWFKSNHMVANPNKFQSMFLGTKNKVDLCLDINRKTSRTTTFVTLLGIEIDWKMSFNRHVKAKCWQAYFKAKALAHLRYKLDQGQKLTLYHSYIMSCIHRTETSNRAAPSQFLDFRMGSNCDFRVVLSHVTKKGKF